MEPPSTSDRVLSTWKEIAQCLGKGVRTVQRWQSLGLPVRRPAGAGSNVVVAYESELREWMANFAANRQTGNEDFASFNSRLAVLREKIDEMERTITALSERLERGVSAITSQIAQGDATEQPFSVLAVDDNDVHRYAIEKMLTSGGFKVLLAKDGSEALRLATDARPDAILLDVNLPDVTGYKVCNTLRSDVRTRDIPVLFHTAISKDEISCERALSHGGDVFLTYPVERKKLIEVINRCIENHRASSVPSTQKQS